MLVTDGATEMYDDVFAKYNWPERRVGYSFTNTFQIVKKQLTLQSGGSFLFFLCGVRLVVRRVFCFFSSFASLFNCPSLVGIPPQFLCDVVWRLCVFKGKIKITVGNYI